MAGGVHPVCGLSREARSIPSKFRAFYRTSNNVDEEMKPITQFDHRPRSTRARRTKTVQYGAMNTKSMQVLDRNTCALCLSWSGPSCVTTLRKQSGEEASSTSRIG